MTWLATTDALAQHLPGYESRTEQDRLATSIEHALADRTHVLAQAGCGTGKSFAYLSAAYDFALAMGGPVGVATATKALQDQLSDKDLPFLAEIFPGLRYAVVKGRSNYVCQAKLNGPEAEQVANVADVRRELDETPEHSGDLDSLITEIRPADRSKLAVVADECPGKRDCPFGEVCFAEAAKARAQDAHIVVANHAVLLRDTEIKNASNGKAGMLPYLKAVVVDEAHELEDYATSALGVEFTQRSLERFGDDAAAFLKDPVVAAELRKVTHALFVKLDEVMGRRESTVRLTDELLSELGEELVGVWEATQGVQDLIKRVRPEDDTHALSKKRFERRAAGMVTRLGRVITAESDEIVRWGEREEREFRGRKEVTVKLAFAPLHVGEYLATHLWQYLPAVLVSATLATDGDFSYLAGRLGLEDYTGFDAGSPFEFAKQALLYTPLSSPRGNFPEPTYQTQDRWQAMMAAESGELIRAAGGRTLALFTSRRSMNATYTALQPTLRAMGVTVLKQGDAPNVQLAQRFKTDETSVLFALKSFMTGADFQGDCCRLVIIDKLPFAVPSDVVFQARAEAIDAVKTGWNDGSFMKLSVPSMTLTLLQAFGRAIRTKTDKAAVVIFDPRLNSKGYGKGILRALPDARRVNDLNSAIAFLQAI
jgi:ATP-dependent DNA helicase DinG